MQTDNQTSAHTCLFCGLRVIDGREIPGFTGIGPVWMTEGGDVGCDESPETHPEEGVGSHAVTNEEANRAETSPEALAVSQWKQRQAESAERLIAAAPDLLEALMAIKRDDFDGWNLLTDPVKEAIDTAIARATGGDE